MAISVALQLTHTQKKINFDLFVGQNMNANDQNTWRKILGPGEE